MHASPLMDPPLLLHEDQVLGPHPEADRPVLSAGVQAGGIRTQAQTPHTAAVTREYQNLLEPGATADSSNSSSIAEMYSVNYCSRSIVAAIQQLIENQYVSRAPALFHDSLLTRRRSQTHCAALVRLVCDRRSMVQHKQSCPHACMLPHLSASQYLHTPSLPAEKK